MLKNLQHKLRCYQNWYLACDISATNFYFAISSTNFKFNPKFVEKLVWACSKLDILCQNNRISYIFWKERSKLSHQLFCNVSNSIRFKLFQTFFHCEFWRRFSFPFENVKQDILCFLDFLVNIIHSFTVCMVYSLISQVVPWLSIRH